MEETLLELLIRYDGNTQALLDAVDRIWSPDQTPLRFIPLLSGFGILYAPERAVIPLSLLPEIFYLEAPSTLFYAATQAQYASCIPQAIERYGLSGQGVLMGIADSGIDLTHPDFQNPDGTTRIQKLWDQTASASEPGAPGSVPMPYGFGREYTSAEINAGIVPEQDANGHGTAVAGIAAGNGASSGGVYAGVAPQSSLIIVKLGIPETGSFPRTSQLMMAVDYLLRTATALKQPMAVNLSFGNNYGAHNGSSMLELYLNAVTGFGQTAIVTGAGNEGAAAIHSRLKLDTPETHISEIALADFQTPFNLQVWYASADQFHLELEAPNGTRIPLDLSVPSNQYSYSDFLIQVTARKSNPYNPLQEVFLTFYPTKDFLSGGIWKLHFTPVHIRTGQIRLWLSGADALQPGTRFLRPYAEGTITIPGTAQGVLTVGAYHSDSRTYADFSGQGFSDALPVKPDLAAPGVSIPAPAPGGGYASYTGTSFAAPQAAGCAALLMEWGIVRQNDPFLFGERLKGMLKRGAVPLTGNNTPPILSLPNPRTGFGAICLADSITE